jgi:hypothetical protein
MEKATSISWLFDTLCRDALVSTIFAHLLLFVVAIVPPGIFMLFTILRVNGTIYCFVAPIAFGASALWVSL